MNFGIRQEAFVDDRCSSLPLSDSNVSDWQAIGSLGDFNVKPGRTGSSCCSTAGKRWRSLIQKVSRPQDTELRTQQSSSEDESTALKNRRAVGQQLPKTLSPLQASVRLSPLEAKYTEDRNHFSVITGLWLDPSREATYNGTSLRSKSMNYHHKSGPRTQAPQPQQGRQPGEAAVSGKA